MINKNIIKFIENDPKYIWTTYLNARKYGYNLLIRYHENQKICELRTTGLEYSNNSNDTDLVLDKDKYKRLNDLLLFVNKEKQDKTFLNLDLVIKKLKDPNLFTKQEILQSYLRNNKSEILRESYLAKLGGKNLLLFCNRLNEVSLYYTKENHTINDNKLIINYDKYSAYRRKCADKYCSSTKSKEPTIEEFNNEKIKSAKYKFNDIVIPIIKPFFDKTIFDIFIIELDPLHYIYDTNKKIIDLAYKCCHFNTQYEIVYNTLLESFLKLK